MRIVSYNVNGIRAAIRKGLTEFVANDRPDILSLQEVKAMREDVDLTDFEAMGYHIYWFPAEKKGYSGVATFSLNELEDVKYGSGHEQSDQEGRWLEWTINGIRMVNAYFPSGTSGDLRQDYKYKWLDDAFESVQGLLQKNKNLVLMGDYNIAHTEVDIHNPVSNKNSSGFLPEERAWMSKFLASGMNDSFRILHPDTLDAYSWWSYRANARANNKGWRIDYITISDALKARLESAEILPDVSQSDHCPITIELS